MPTTKRDLGRGSSYVVLRVTVCDAILIERLLHEDAKSTGADFVQD